VTGPEREPFGAPWSRRRLLWSALLVLVLLLVYRCSAENAAQLGRYTHHHRHQHATVAMAVIR
jgi:hypothetical protein